MVPQSVVITGLLFRWRIVIVMMVTSLQRRLSSSLLAAPPLGVKPKDWSAYMATQASLWDSFSSNRVGFTGKGKGLA